MNLCAVCQKPVDVGVTGGWVDCRNNGTPKAVHYGICYVKWVLMARKATGGQNGHSR